MPCTLRRNFYFPTNIVQFSDALHVMEEKKCNLNAWCLDMKYSPWLFSIYLKICSIVLVTKHFSRRMLCIHPDICAYCEERMFKALLVYVRHFFWIAIQFKIVTPNAITIFNFRFALCAKRFTCLTKAKNETKTKIVQMRSTRQCICSTENCCDFEERIIFTGIGKNMKKKKQYGSRHECTPILCGIEIGDCCTAIFRLL